MKFFGAVIIFLISFLVVLLLIGFLFLRKFIINIKRHLTGDFDDETVKRMSDKHYRGDDNPEFDKDYFKGSGSTRGRRGTSQQQQQQQQQQQRQQPQSTTTAEGVTIIDKRTQDERKKIFEKNEGEYVEFVEES